MNHPPAINNVLTYDVENHNHADKEKKTMTRLNTRDCFQKTEREQ